VSSVTIMDGMFWSASSFNQNLSSWNVLNFNETPANFAAGSNITSNSSFPIWGTDGGVIPSNQTSTNPLTSVFPGFNFMSILIFLSIIMFSIFFN